MIIVHAGTSENTERRRRLARLKVAGLRERQLDIDYRDEQRDPEYLPEPRQETAELQEDEILEA